MPKLNPGIAVNTGWSTPGVAGRAGQDGAAGSTSKFVQSVMAEISADTSTSSSAYVSLLTTGAVSFGGSGSSRALIRFSACAANPGGGTGDFQLLLDGSPVRAASILATGISNTVAIMYRTGSLSSGNHTISVQYRQQGGGQVQINPVSQPNNQHAVLVVEEVLA